MVRKMHVITIATDENDWLNNWKSSAKKWGYEYSILGKGREWKGFSTKIKLIIEFFMPLWDADAVRVVAACLFQDSTADALAVAGLVNSLSLYNQQLALVHIMDAGTTSSTTFKIRIGPNSGTLFLNRRANATVFGSTTLHATLRITEVAA